jgi:very-short-patch-repair endonuclease
VAWDVQAVVGEVGWITAADLQRQVSPRTVGSWVSTGKLVLLRPGVYALPSAAPAWRIRLGAALAGGHGVASHVTALALWGLVEHPPGPVHITVDLARSARGSKGITIHRSAGIDAERRRHDGFSVTSVERTVVDTWGLPAPLSRADVRAAAITAVRRRQCAAGDVALALARRPHLPGRADLSQLAELLAAGCQSELEIWGCLNVLRAPGMPPFVQQRRIVVRGQVFWLDAAYDEVKLAVEMDGAAWHGSRKQREDDIRRDALVATIGWQTLRFAFRRMSTAPEACRRDILAVHAARRALFMPNGER